MNTTIPDGMPTLAPGQHAPHHGFACVMEYVSVLAGEQWSDNPNCTHAVIASVARAINDNDEDHRQELLSLVPRLLTANVPRNQQKQVTEALQEFIARREREMHPEIVVTTDGFHISMSFTTHVVSETQHARGIALLTALLDEFERITERTPRQVTPEQYAHATELVSADV